VDNTPGDKLGVWRDMRLADALVYFFRFFNAVWALTSGGFRIVSDTLVDIAILSVRSSHTGIR